jgi:hypothetical protein
LDPAARRWYASWPGITTLGRWAAAPALPEVLPVEDRSFAAGLFVDLIPRSCWFTNARFCVGARDWERLRAMVTGRAGQRARCAAAAATCVPGSGWKFMNGELTTRLPGCSRCAG